MQRTCCPQYTIRLDATTFKATKSQRQVANRFAAFIRGGSPVSTVEPTPTQGVISKQKHKGKGKASIPFAIDAIFQECTSTCHTQAHRLEVKSPSLHSKLFLISWAVDQSRSGDIQ